MRYRADYSEPQKDGATLWFARWLGGPTISKVQNCHWESHAGDVLITAFVTGEADTAFSIPAYCNYRGCRVRGYLTSSDAGDIVFRHCYY
ncbi:hypothetical protein GGD67_003852 [Bradyrhizobium sp. IAR9]|nr:hypothetical protein [Bradyrhizobium sp. IAR9]